MATATLGAATSFVASRSASKPFFARVIDAMVESRRRQAEREIARYRQLIPMDEVEQAGYRIALANSDELPFAR